MKRTFFSRIILVLFLILFLILSSVSIASNETLTDSDDENILASLETNYSFVNSDLFLFDADIEISEIVHGNVFAYGGTVTVTGEVYGDLFVFASSLEIAEGATVNGNIFAMANNITISGQATDVYSMSSNSFNIEENALIKRSINIISDAVSISGTVQRSANIYCNSLSLAEGAENLIGENLNYTSQNEASIPDGSVSGEIKFTPVKVDESVDMASIVTDILSALLYSFVFIMLTIWIAPNFKDRVCEIISKKSFMAFGIGLLIFFGIIIVAFTLLFFTTGLGTSIAIAAAVLLVLVYSVANTVFSMSISKLITNKFNFKGNVAFVLITLLFVLVIDLIQYIPYVGGPIAFITAIIGLGIIGINAYKRKDLVAAKED